jgi:hypothetical protein
MSDAHAAPNMLTGGAAEQLLPRGVCDRGPFETGLADLAGQEWSSR